MVLFSKMLHLHKWETIYIENTTSFFGEKVIDLEPVCVKCMKCGLIKKYISPYTGDWSYILDEQRQKIVDKLIINGYISDDNKMVIQPNYEKQDTYIGGI